MARILIVDDDDSNADVIQLLLEDAGHRVASIQDCGVLWETIARFIPELIVMDILLQKGDGRILCNEIKKNENTMFIPIILLTAMLKTPALALKSHADVLMFKPFDCNLLLKRIEALTGSPAVKSCLDISK